MLRPSEDPRIREQIQAMIDRETLAWDRLDADALVDLFHPDMVWPWPLVASAHDPLDWVFTQGRFDRAQWREDWQGLFDTHQLIHNQRITRKITVSDRGDGAFAVVDIDTLWRDADGNDFHWKGRTGKGYTRVDGAWKLIFHTGVLDYGLLPRTG